MPARKLDHPLLNGNLYRKVGKLNPPDALKDKFSERIGEIIMAYDDACIAVAGKAEISRAQVGKTLRSRRQSLVAERDALVKMVEEDYDRVLAPLTLYKETIERERDALLNAINAHVADAIQRHNQYLAEVVALVDVELQRFKDDLFKEGKEAINGAHKSLLEAMRLT